MWTEIFLLAAVTTITAHGRINGLQNDLVNGYSYDPPASGPTSATIHESLGFYINVPPNQNPLDHFALNSNPADQYIQYASQNIRAPQQDFELQSINQQYSQPELQLQSNLALSQYNPYDQLQATRNSVYNTYYNFPSVASPFETITTNRFQQPAYQIDPRSRAYNQQSPAAINLSQGSRFNIPQLNYKSSYPYQNYHQQPIRNQNLIPPTPTYNPHVTLQVESKSFDRTAPKDFRVVPSVASLPLSQNAQLPFPIGAVPIKFKPLPLKTHVRQSELLPITSYRLKEPYMK